MKLGKYCWGALEERGLGLGGGVLRVKRRENKRRRSKLWKQMSVKSKFKDGSDSVISEYDIATYFTYIHTHGPFVIQSGLYRVAFTYQHYLSLCHSLLINLPLYSNPAPITRRA